MQFKPGQSGNPRGRRAGSRNKATLAIDKLLDGEGQSIARKAVDLAKAGDLTAIRICMERLCPPRKDRPVMFDLPKLRAAADAVTASAAIVEAVAIGDLTPSEAAELSRVVDGFTRAFTAADLEARL